MKASKILTDKMLALHKEADSLRARADLLDDQADVLKAARREIDPWYADARNCLSNIKPGAAIRIAEGAPLVTVISYDGKRLVFSYIDINGKTKTESRYIRFDRMITPHHQARHVASIA